MVSVFGRSLPPHVLPHWQIDGECVGISLAALGLRPLNFASITFATAHPGSFSRVSMKTFHAFSHDVALLPMCHAHTK